MDGTERQSHDSFPVCSWDLCFIHESLTIQSLVCLQPEFLKLDRFLVRGTADNAAARRMAALLLDYARESGTRVIGEGFETAEEFNCLLDARAPDRAAGPAARAME
ncbi:EAL domain-containing protein [Kyrpidia tusciae]|uniref:EAL domain-containing protein n=1 Tax=Kyrpidia tusciae TaxID=33943 RepID=UPI00059B5EF7|nr:EAL domain-containing protein [Kyrpidia tusciae]